ncbi:MAG: transporter transrane region [Gemmatimonadetes bacterium]|nr:transporter transrane region [Gemmatimonadota bacterium]
MDRPPPKPGLLPGQRLPFKELITGGPLRQILPRLKPHRWRLAGATLMLLASSSISLIFPTVVGRLLDSAFGHHGERALNNIAGSLMVLFVFQAVLTFAQTYILGATGERVVAGLRLDLFRHLLGMPPAFFADRRTGELTSRLSADVGMLQGVLSGQITEMFKQFILLVGAVTLLFVTHAQLALVTLLVVPVVVFTAFFFGKRLNKASLGVMDQVADATAIAEEAFSQIRVVQSFVGEPHEGQRYGTRMQGAVEVALKRAVTRGLFFSAMSFATLSGTVAVLWVGGHMVLRGELTAGTLVTFLLYSGMVANSFGAVGQLWSMYQEATGAASRVFEIMNARPSLRDPDQPKTLAQPVRGEIVFDNVWFRYEPPAELPQFMRMPMVMPGAGMRPPPPAPAPAADADEGKKDAKKEKKDRGGMPVPGMMPPGMEKPAGMIALKGAMKLGDDGKPLAPEWTLRGINLRIEPGETVALVGRSGSGKTTLASLIPRFWDVQQGAISMDGLPIKDLRLSDLRYAIGLVPQETLLFSGSIRENIAYGRPDASDAEVEAAARGAHAHEFVERLQDGYDAVVGERGIKLSGGQRQRIALARALLKDPAVLILDEATSSLDAESEALIEDALGHMLGGRTTVIIAHRLSTVRRADRLLVIERGMIVEEGTHSELLAQNGIYSKLYSRQFRGDGETADDESETADDAALVG